MESVKIEIKLSPSHVGDQFLNVSLKQLGLKSIEEWDNMDYVEKHNLVTEIVDGMPDQPYWNVEGFKVKS